MLSRILPQSAANNMKRYLSLTSLFFKYTLMRESAYRVDLIMWSLVTLGWFIFNITFWQLLFANIDSLGGWTKGQVFVLQGFFFLIDFLIWGIFYGSLEHIPKKINRGEIDFEVTKPINTQFLLSFNSYNLNQIVNLVMGIALIIYGFKLQGVSPEPLDILISILIFILTGVFLYGGYFTTVCIAFWFDRLGAIVYLFPGVRTFSKVPQPAYRGLVGVIVTFVFPVALIATLPSQALFGSVNYWLVLYLAIFSILSIKLSNWVFKKGLRRYSSASS